MMRVRRASTTLTGVSRTASSCRCEGPHMRRVIVMAAEIVGAVVIFVGAIFFYAATNLNSIIAERRQAILDKVSIALGRQVHADDIKVTLGWGILADVTGGRVSGDRDT